MTTTKVVEDVQKQDLKYFDPSDIKVGWRARKDENVDSLAESISRLGQMQPIVLRKDKDNKLVIIAGLRRLTACRKLGIQVKALVVEPKDELSNIAMQLEENIKRKDFDHLEVGEGLKRYKHLYEKKHGQDWGRNFREGERDEKGHVKDANKESFVAEVARVLGMSISAIYNHLSLAELPKEEKKEIRSSDSSKERNKAARMALSKIRKDKKLKQLEDDANRSKNKTVDTAVDKKEPIIKVIEGNCLKLFKQQTFIKSYTGAFNLVCTDPMYNLERNPILHDSRTPINESNLNKWDKLDISWVIAVAPFIADKGSVLAFSPLELVGLYKIAFSQAKLTYRCCIIWHRTNPPPAHRSVYSSACEAIVWATKGDKYAFTPWENAGTADAHNFIETPTCGGDERLNHPFQKPLVLLERLIAKHTTFESVVLDPFAGTGTTLVACAKAGIKAVGIELEQKYVKMIEARTKSVTK
jgi:site-specific DNA-methyltransferase (adenine-specific)